MQQTRKPKRVPDLRASGRFSKAKKTLMLLSMVAPDLAAAAAVSADGRHHPRVQELQNLSQGPDLPQ